MGGDLRGKRPKLFNAEGVALPLSQMEGHRVERSGNNVCKGNALMRIYINKT